MRFPPDRFTTSYSIWGVKLNVDRLLAESPPRTAYDAWRRGDPNPLGGGCMTSGVSIKLFQGWSPGDLHQAIRRFLRLDAAFLRAARRRVRAGTVSQLSATVFVGEDEALPAGLGATIAAAQFSSGSRAFVERLCVGVQEP